MTTGTCFVLTGPSGVGKSTVQERILKRYPDMVMPLGVITRRHRIGEIPDSLSISLEDYTRLLLKKELTATQEYAGNFYGTPISSITVPLAQGKNLIRIFSVYGVQVALKDLKGWPIVVIALTAPAALIRQRLLDRGDSDDSVGKRMAIIQDELDICHTYDYVVDTARDPDAVADVVARIIDSYTR